MIFTGSVSTSELRHERGVEFDRVRVGSALDRIGGPAPSPASVRRGYIIGTIGLSLGLALFALIVYATIR